MALDLSALKAAVAAVQGTEASTKELVVQLTAHEAAVGVKIQGLIDQLANQGADPQTVADLQAAADSLTQSATELVADNQGIADAVAANPA